MPHGHLRAFIQRKVRNRYVVKTFVMGLPSLRSLDGALAKRVWLAAESTDMLCVFDRLAERVKAVISQDQLSCHLFVFARVVAKG